MVHGYSGHTIFDPFGITTNIDLCIYSAGATPDKLLATTPHGSKYQWICSAKINTALLLAVFYARPRLGRFPKTSVPAPCALMSPWNSFWEALIKKNLAYCPLALKLDEGVPTYLGTYAYPKICLCRGDSWGIFLSPCSINFLLLIYYFLISSRGSQE